MSDDRKKKSGDNETYFAAVFSILFLLFIGGILLVSKIQVLVPKPSYIQGIVKYADDGINTLERLHYPLIVGSLKDAKNRLLKLESEMESIAKFEEEYQKTHHAKGFKMLKLLFSSKDNPYKDNLERFAKCYMDYVLVRAKIFFLYLLSQIIEIEYATIGITVLAVVLPLLRILYVRYVEKPVEDRRLYVLAVNLFLASIDDRLGFVEAHPVAGKHLINVDAFRDYVRDGLLGHIKPIDRDALSKFRESDGYWRYFHAMGTAMVYMKRALVEKNGELKPDKYGYPASITGNHNPDDRYGLLVHSLMVAYYAAYLASLDGVKDTLELLKVFYAGLSHDFGKIRLYRKVVGKVEVIESPDAVEGDKHIKEAKKKAKKNVVKWVSLETMKSDQEVQMKIFIAKTSKVQPDKRYMEAYVKPADHACVDAELRYTALRRKERHALFEKAFKEFFRESEKNRVFNSFDEDMLGVVFDVGGRKRLFLLATFATRLRRFIEKRYSKGIKDLKLKLPMSPVSFAGGGWGNKLRTFTYPVSQFLHERGMITLLKEPKADILGLYDVSVKRSGGQVVDYNACWLVNDFDAFCREFDLEPVVAEDGVEVVDIVSRLPEDRVDVVEMKRAEREFEESKPTVEADAVVGQTVEVDESILEELERMEKGEPASGENANAGKGKGGVVDKGNEEDTTDKDVDSQSNANVQPSAIGELNANLSMDLPAMGGNERKGKEKESAGEEKPKVAESKRDAEGKQGVDEPKIAEKERKIKLRHIKLAYRLDGADPKDDIFRVRNYLSEEAYKRLRDDTYERYGGRCALCGTAVDKRNATVMEVYKPVVEKDENGNSVKKLKLVGTELLCKMCYMVKMTNIKELENDGNYRKSIVNVVRRIVGDVNEKNIVDHFKSVDRKRKEIQAEYGKISLSWLRENGYVGDNNGNGDKDSSN